MTELIRRKIVGDAWETVVDSGGDVTPGTVVPVAKADGATVEEYADNWTHSGNIQTLVLPTAGDTALAIAVEGDAYPRILMMPNPADGFYYGDGTIDPFVDGAAWWIAKDANGKFSQTIEGGAGGTQRAVFGDLDSNVGYRTTFKSAGIAFGADPQTAGELTLSSGAGAPAVGGNVGDIYIRTNPGGANETFYRCTVAGVAGAATWVGIL